MSSQPPWMEDETPPWEIDDTAAEAPEQFGREQMAKFGQSPSTGFAGTTSARDHLSAIEADEPPGPGDPRFYGDPNSPEALRQAGEFKGTAGAAGPSAAILGTALGLPTGKAAAVRAGWGLLGGAAGGAGGAALGRGLEYAGFPAGTSKVTGTLGGLAGGFAGGVGKGPALEKVGELLASPFTKGASRGVGREAAEEFMRRRLELEAAKLAEREAARGATTALREKALTIAERKAIDAVKIAEARLQVAVSRQSGSNKIQEARLALQKARDEASKKLGEGRLAESVRKTDIGKEVSGARLKEQVRRGMASTEQGAARVGQGAERVSQGERRLQIAEERARKQGLLPPKEAAGAQGAAPASLSPEQQQLVLQIQQRIKTEAGRAEVRQWLQSQPREVQNQVKALLERGLAQPGTTASGGVRSVPSGPSLPAGYGSELAKLLGQ